MFFIDMEFKEISNFAFVFAHFAINSSVVVNYLYFLFAFPQIFCDTSVGHIMFSFALLISYSN